LVGVAVKVTLVPTQTVVPKLDEILTDGVKTGFTVIVITLEPAPVGLAHVALLVIAQVTKSPFTSPALE
jgi:hypothetical protein